MSPIIEALTHVPDDLPILLIGPPGCGKSAAIAAWAESTGRPLLIDHPPIAQSVDYRGLPAVTADGTSASWLPLGTLRQIAQPGASHVVLLDDVGQASPAVQAALMQLVWARRMGDLEVAPGVRFVLASNRAEDRGAVRPLLAPLVNRCITVEVPSPDPAAWADWAIAQTELHPAIAGYARFRAGASTPLFAQAVPADGGPFCTPRSMAAAGRLLHATRSLSLLSGAIGRATAADLTAWLAVADKLPSTDAVLDNPAVLAGVRDPGLLHAICALLSRRSDRLADVFRAAEAIGGAWHVLVVSGLVAAHPEAQQSPEFRAWAAGPGRGLL